MNHTLPVRGVRLQYTGYELAHWMNGTGREQSDKLQTKVLFDSEQTVFGRPSLAFGELVKDALRGVFSKDNYEILDEAGEVVLGEVTSGGMAPSLGYGIALGYVPKEYSKRGTPVKIRIRKRLVEGKIVKSHPFYDDSVYGWKRDLK